MPPTDATSKTLRSISDRERFEHQLKPVLALAFRYAVRLAGNRDEAMDLLQDTSVAAFRNFHQFDPGSNFKAWFLKILTNQYYRRRQLASRLPSITLEEAPDLFLYLQAKRLGVPMEGDPSSFILGQADGEMICAALERLADEYRVVATLHFLTEMSYEECAETLDIPLGTVRSRLHRARRQLQVSLWQVAEERGYVNEEGAR